MPSTQARPAPADPAPYVVLVESAEAAPLLAKPYFASGAPGPLVASLALVPEFLATAIPFFGTVLGDSAIPARLKEIVVLRTAVLAGCRYCTNAHTVVALDATLSAADVAVLRSEPAEGARGVSTFDPREAAALAFTEALLADPANAVRHLRPVFEDHEIVELTTVASLALMLTRYATALALPTSAATFAALAAAGFDAR